MEEFRAINGYEYEVSNLGNVKNKKTGRILVKAVDGTGYHTVGLSNDGDVKTHKVHRLVCEAFHPNPNDLATVDHIDNNKINNHIDNLRWASFQENCRNVGLTSRNTTGVKGCSYNQKNKKYTASICSNGVIYYLGMFPTLARAKQARINKARQLFGAFRNACET